MPKHERFNFSSLDELRNKVNEIGCDLKFSDDISVLCRPIPIAAKFSPNAMAVLPMEGCDCDSSGTPSELTERRYLRHASGGAGLLWWEACAVLPEARANPGHMILTPENAAEYTKLIQKCNQEAINRNGQDHKPIHILQLTHAGRYSRPEGHKMKPVIAQHDPMLDPRIGIDSTYPVVTDAFLDDLPAFFVKAALIAQECGFDGIDIKACHRYLVSELLASHKRDGRYGGSFENRSRLLLEIVRSVKKAVNEDFIVAVRFNAYDAHPYPYGFGVKHEEASIEYDSNEPIRLAKQMVECGVQLLCTSAGNPYYTNPYVTRPFDAGVINAPNPPEHPLESAARLFSITRDIQQAVEKFPVVGSGYSWFREFLPNVGAANVSAGSCGFVGLGRLSFAYPDAPRDIVRGSMDPKKVCVACSKCTQIMRDHGKSGCVVRDKDVYVPLYRESREDAIKRESL